MQKKTWVITKNLSIFFKLLSYFPPVLMVFVKVFSWLRWFFRGMRYADEDLYSEKIFFNDCSCMYAANPKVATRSMIRFLNSNFDDVKVEHKSFSEIISYNSVASVKAFTFVRNPWERVYSCWSDKISNKVGVADITIITRYLGLYPDMPFKDFVIWLSSEEGSDKYADRHWMSQAKLLNVDSNDLDFCFIGKLESIDEDFFVLSDILDLPRATLPHRNSTKSLSNTKSYMGEYDDELIELVFLRYRTDIEKFGYSFK